MDFSTSGKRNGKLLRVLRTGVVAGLVIGLLAIEFGTDSPLVRYSFYGLIALYLASIGLRAFKFRKHILYHFAPGTKEALGERFSETDERLKSELNRLSEGYEIGFVKAFASEFRQIDKSARSEPTKLDAVLEFVEYAFPFQSNLISVISKPLKGIINKRSFRVSIAQSQNGSFSLNAFSQNEQTPDIHVDEQELDSCIREAACRMFHEMHASELTRSYPAFRHYDQAFRIWERIYRDGQADSTDFEQAATRFKQALETDPNFILAELYLAAMEAYRPTTATNLHNAKIRLSHVIQRCEEARFPGSKSQRSKYKGLATTLLCFLTNQWLHRMGKYDNEDQAILIAKTNQLKAREAVTLLKDSPIAIHQYAFSLHSLEQIALRNPQSAHEIAESYAKAHDQYSLAIKVASKKNMQANVQLSSGNRAYVSMWLGAMLHKSSLENLRLRALGRQNLDPDQAASTIWIQAEDDMKSVYAQSSGTTGHYAIANLCLLYALKGDFKKIPSCGLFLTGVRKKIETVDEIPYSIDTVQQLEPENSDYIEGLNDLATGLLVACANGNLSKDEYATWLNKGIALQKRSLELIHDKEHGNVETQRIRIVKQITNFLKVLHYTSGEPRDGTDKAFLRLRERLEQIRSEQEFNSGFINNWLFELQDALSPQCFATEATFEAAPTKSNQCPATPPSIS